jgi:uncharacterized protein YjdB
MNQRQVSRRLVLTSGVAAVGSVLLHKTPAFGQALRDGRPQEYVDAEPSRTGILQYMAHIELYGDTNYFNQPDWCGASPGQALRLEGFAIRLAPRSANVNLRYKAHLQDIGDTSWHFLGQFIGTRGQSKRLEAFAIEVVGDAASRYDVYYKAHIQDDGDTAWERNGSWCGTRGQNKRLEAIAIYLADR